MNNETDMKEREIQKLKIFVTFSKWKCNIPPIAWHESSQGDRSIALLF